MDVCDSTFSNTTTFKSLPQTFHKTQPRMCLKLLFKAELSCSGKGSLAHSSELETPADSPRCQAAGPGALVLHRDSQPGTGHFCWMSHWPPSFHPRVRPRSWPPPTTCWGPPGAGSLLSSSYGAAPICFTTKTGWFNLLFRQEKGFSQTSAHLNRVFSPFPTHICTLVFLEAICTMRE